MMNKKVLFVIDKIENGGAEKIMLDYKSFLEKNGYSVLIFSLYGETPRKDVKYGLKYNSNSIIIKLLHQIELYLKLKFLTLKYRPDAIYSFLERSNIIVQLLGNRKFTKILSVHNLLSIQYEKIHNKFVKRLTFRLITTLYNRNKTIIIAVSSQVKNDLINKFNVNEEYIHVINNAVDKNDILLKSKEPISEFEYDSNNIYIINIGRFTLQKSQYRLIKLLYRLRKEGLNIKLILIGKGELEEEITKLIDLYHVRNDVHIIPFTNNPYKFMRISSLLILPSLYEGFPIVLSEASAIGLPVIGSNTAIPVEIFSDKNSSLKYTFHNHNYNPDYSLNLDNDDEALYNLAKIAIKDKELRNKWNKDISKWKDYNSKEIQFNQYLSIVNGYKN